MYIKKEEQKTAFDEGYLTQMYTDLVHKVKVNKLHNHTLTRIATMLGKLSYGHDLYDLLFEQPQQTLEFDGIKVNTKDLMAFVLMDHTFTRGWFANLAGTKATSDTTNSQGVPLALEGAKRLHNKSYMSWLPEHMNDINEVWKLDVFLPAELGSIHLNDKDELELNDKYGLCILINNDINFSTEEIIKMQEEVPHYMVTHRPRMLYMGETNSNYDIYNKCTYKIRAMLLQGWIWQPACRNDDMICSITNWDEYPLEIKYKGNATIKVPGLGRYI